MSRIRKYEQHLEEKYHKTYKSKYTGDLEVCYVNGKKVLYGGNSTYSYGCVSNIWKESLQKISFDGIDNILVLGMGAGTILDLLDNEFKYSGNITMVEIDPIIVKIAKDEFGISETENVKIICGDAFGFIKKSKFEYDMIIVDIFIDDKLPPKILSSDFWMNISRNSSQYVIFNAYKSTSSINKINNMLESEGFEISVYPKINKSNLVVIAKKII